MGRIAARNDSLGVALLQELTSSGVKLGIDWERVACAALLTMSLVRNKNSSVLSALADLPADRSFHALAYDSASTEIGAVLAYRASSQAGAAVVIGAVRSSASRTIAHLSWADRIPQASVRLHCQGKLTLLMKP